MPETTASDHVRPLRWQADPPAVFEATCAPGATRPTLRLAGELCMLSTSAFHPVLSGWLDSIPAPRTVEVDLRMLTFVDVRGLRLLLHELPRQARRLEHTVRYRDAPPALLRLAHASGMPGAQALDHAQPSAATPPAPPVAPVVPLPASDRRHLDSVNRRLGEIDAELAELDRLRAADGHIFEHRHATAGAHRDEVIRAIEARALRTRELQRRAEELFATATTDIGRERLRHLVAVYQRGIDAHERAMRRPVGPRRPDRSALSPQQ